MSVFSSLFSGANFRVTMRRYCQKNGWKILDLDDRRCILSFHMESGRTQILYVIRYDTTLEFSVPSMAAFDNVEDIPHYVSTMLLQRNKEPRIGFWCIEKIGEKHVFSVMHNAEMPLIDAEYFGRVVLFLVHECDVFEGFLTDNALPSPN
ncbi:MAG: hypothetical protein QHJ73_10080 [Armatimonadota bacterium]|nr:hypothetical protein [Armatimonadota bacterium]